MGQQAPNLLSELKQNLVGIFSKDNPVMKARETALSDYLSTPQRARADMLPPNMAMIEGRNLALSPTQQDAIVGSRSAAALAPLAGLNEMLKAQYGNIGEMVQGAGSIYDSTMKNAQSNAANLMQLYKMAADEEDAAAARKAASAGSQGLDLASIMAMIRGEDPTMGANVDDFYGTPDANPLLSGIAGTMNRAQPQQPTVSQNLMKLIKPVFGGATTSAGGSLIGNTLRPAGQAIQGAAQQNFNALKDRFSNLF
jgi:hypothetical protein